MVKSNIFSGSFKTFEHLFTEWRMFFKMTLFVFLALFVLQAGLLFFLYKKSPNSFFKGFDSVDRCVFMLYTKANIFSSFSMPGTEKTVLYQCEGQPITVYVSEFKSTFKQYYDNFLLPAFWLNLRNMFVMTCPIYMFYFIILYLFAKAHDKSTADKFRRGKQIVDEEQFADLLKPLSKGFKIRINDRIWLPESVTTKHCFAIGATGSGKSQLAFRMVQQLLEHGTRCIIHDFKGDFVPVFYDPKKHYIFNPLDERHMGLADAGSTAPGGWTVFNELQTLPNVDSFAASMIPDGPGEQIWYTAPRDLLKAMIIWCMKNGKTTNQDLLDMIETSPDKLRDLFEKTPGCKVGLKHLEEAKLGGQFMSILATYTASLSYLAGTDGDFSIRQWIQDEQSEKRVIFVSNQAEVQKTLKTLISTFFDFSTKALCTLPDDPDGRRIYFILDEFGQLSKMDSVVQLLTQGRSKGGAAMLFIQDSAQIDAIYGKDLSSSIVNGCRNRFFFNVSDHNTAEFISKAIGSQELERTRESKSFGVSDLKDSISINSEIVERPLVMASEVQAQKNLTFFLQVSEFSEVAHVEIDYRKFPTYTHPYQPRDISIMSYGENESSSDGASPGATNNEKDAEQSFFDEMKAANPEPITPPPILPRPAGFEFEDAADPDTIPEFLEGDKIIPYQDGMQIPTAKPTIALEEIPVIEEPEETGDDQAFGAEQLF